MVFLHIYHVDSHRQPRCRRGCMALLLPNRQRPRSNRCLHQDINASLGPALDGYVDEGRPKVREPSIWCLLVLQEKNLGRNSGVKSLIPSLGVNNFLRKARQLSDHPNHVKVKVFLRIKCKPSQANPFLSRNSKPYVQRKGVSLEPCLRGPEHGGRSELFGRCHQLRESGWTIRWS